MFIKDGRQILQKHGALTLGDAAQCLDIVEFGNGIKEQRNLQTDERRVLFAALRDFRPATQQNLRRELRLLAFAVD